MSNTIKQAIDGFLLNCKVEGNRLEYRFEPSDSIVKQIVDRVKDQQTEKSKTKNFESKQH